MKSGRKVPGPDKPALPTRVNFPDPLKVPGDRPFIWSDGVTLPLLLEAYAHGIFPWPGGEGPIGWHSPDPRGVLVFKDFKIPKSFLKEMKKADSLVCTWCANFDLVIESCRAMKRAGDVGTWITEEMVDAYKKLFAMGGAWSVEVWEESTASDVNDDGSAEDSAGINSKSKGINPNSKHLHVGMDHEALPPERKLIGGLYGTALNGVYGGESMFSSAPNASKYGLIFLREHLMSKGVEWIDTQTLSPIIDQFGGVLISRSRFFDMLREVQSNYPYSRS